MKEIAFERGHASSLTSVPLNLDITIWLNLHNCSFLIALPSFVSDLCSWEIILSAHLVDPFSDDLVTLEVS